MENENTLLDFLNNMKIDSSVEALQEQMGQFKDLKPGEYIYELKACESFNSKQDEVTKTNMKFVGVVKTLPKIEINDITGEEFISEKGGEVLDEEYSIPLSYFKTHPNLNKVKRFASLPLYQIVGNTISIDPKRKEQLLEAVTSPEKVTKGDVYYGEKLVKDVDLFLMQYIEPLSIKLNSVILRNIQDGKNPMFKLVITPWSKNGKTSIIKNLALFSDISNSNLL
jgi:hypothetical protein